MKVYLKLNEHPLGYLTQADNGFKFTAINSEILLAKEEYPIAMKFFNLNKTGSKIYETMPHLFAQFLPSKERKDLVAKAGIDLDDDDFATLYKVAGLNLMSINFNISQN